jgi:hypothetical protein
MHGRPSRCVASGGEFCPWRGSPDHAAVVNNGATDLTGHRCHLATGISLVVVSVDEHWVHLRTTNPIESTFATVRHRTKITRVPGSKAAGLAMAVKMIMAAQARWRAVNAPHLIALVRAGATVVNGKPTEREDERQPAAPSVETAG